jgi:hypothetical protein
MAIPNYTRDRDRVAQIAASRTEEALDLARTIDEPWFRCQALAFVAYHTADRAQKNRLLAESFAAALLAGDANRIVSVSSWPLKVLCKSGRTEKLTAETERLLEIISREPSPVQRSDALNTLLGALVSGPRPLFWQAFDAFERAARTPLRNGKRNAKGESRLAWWLPVVSQFDAARARQAMEAVQGPVLRERAEAAIQEYANTDPEQICDWPNLR